MKSRIVLVTIKLSTDRTLADIKHEYRHDGYSDEKRVVKVQLSQKKNSGRG